MPNTHLHDVSIRAGDTVRALRSSMGRGYIEGSTYVVRSVFGRSLKTEVDSVGSTTNGWYTHNFVRVDTEAQPPAPVDTEVSYRVSMDGRGHRVQRVTTNYRMVRSAVNEVARTIGHAKTNEDAARIVAALNAAEVK